MSTVRVPKRKLRDISKELLRVGGGQRTLPGVSTEAWSGRIMTTKRLAARAARLLGASRVIPLGKVDHTPIGMAALTGRVRQLRSMSPGGTGRPSNPKATVRSEGR